MAETVHFLTPDGRKKLEQELEFLVTVRRLQVAQELKSAVEEGDITENAGYDEMKREQAFVEGRIRDIEAILHNSQVLQDSKNHDIVSMGSRVTVSEEGESPETYHIVGRAEADPTKGRISNESPLGRALIGRRTGDKIRVDTPSGSIQFEIVAIE